MKAFHLLVLTILLCMSYASCTLRNGRDTDQESTKIVKNRLSLMDSYGFDPFLTWRLNLGPGSLWPGNIPVLSQRPAHPYSPNTPSKDDDEEIGDREPLEPNSDGVVDPEIGLKLSSAFSDGQEDTDSGDLQKIMYNFGPDLDGFRGLFNIFGGPSIKPWWKGPNVCVERIEKDSSGDEDISDKDLPSSFHNVTLQTCVQSPTKYECVNKQLRNGKFKTYTLIHQCCHGFELQNGRDCVKVELFPLIETIKKMNGTEFLAISQDIDDLIKNDNLTVFLPSDEAFKKFADVMLETNQVEFTIDNARRRRRGINGITTTQLLMSHLVKGIHDVAPDDAFQSLLSNSTLQIKSSISPEGEEIMLVNCVKVLSPNVHAINGVVHKVDRVLVPVKMSVSEILKLKSELSTFNEILEKTGLAKNIVDDETWTIFAPSNEAFEKLDQKVLEKIMKGDSCAKNILKHHMLAQYLCAAHVNSKKIIVRNAMDDTLELTTVNKKSANNKIDNYDTQETFTVSNVKVSKPDIVATNGVIHMLDEVIIPDSAMPISALLLKKNLTKFHNIMERAGVMDDLQNWSNMTFFVPTDSAIENFIKMEKSNIKDILEDAANGPVDRESKDALKKFVLHHITQGALQSCELEDNARLDTLDKSKLRTNLYSTLPHFANTYNRATVDCARLLHFDDLQCDNVLHQIDRPLIKYTGTILEQINRHPDLTTLSEILVGTKMEKILNTTSDITFIAPVNEAFDKGLLEGEKAMIAGMMGSHTFKGIICCSGLHNSPWSPLAYSYTIDNYMVRTRQNQIGSATIKKCDQVATNGVLHLTNQVMFRPKSRNPNIDILLYGI